MKILLLGGPKFLGRYLIEAALARGHTVTLFNRGQTHPDLYPEVEKLRGNRDGDLDALRGRQWDTVIDTCGYAPRVVRASAGLLADGVSHYTFISSLSVYSETRQPGMDEGGPLGRLNDESVEQITGETYGPLKVLCERAVEQALPGRALHVRAGLIVGPHDSTDRFTYWPHRIARGGEALLPGRPDYGVQFVDVRDLADWVVRMSEQRASGAFNAAGPDYTLTMAQLFETCREVSGSDARPAWVAEEFLLEAKVAPWTEMPLWIPDPDPGSVGFSTFNCRKAIAAGLAFRPLADTVRDTLIWDATRVDVEWRAGLKPEREEEILRQWNFWRSDHDERK